MANASASANKKRIGELLIEGGLITPGDLREALAAQEHQGGKLVEILVGMGRVSPGDFLSFLAKQPGVASIALTQYDIPMNLVSLVPKEFVREHEAIPIDVLGKLLTVAMVCPLDRETIEQLEKTTGLRVKAMLCSPDDIRSAIRRYYPQDPVQQPAMGTTLQADEAQEVTGSLRLQNAAYLIRQIEALPALPGTVNQIREAMLNPLVCVQDLVDIISKDPGVAAKILSVANSAAYGFANRVDSLSLAISLLGLRETNSIVLSMAMIKALSNGKVFDYRGFWVRAVRCVTAAHLVAQAAGQETAHGLFSAGLLHEIGQLVLSQIAPEAYGEVNQELRGKELLKAEEELLGINHGEAGYQFAIHWGLPSDIADPIRFHHMPGLDPDKQPVVAIIALAAHFVQLDMEAAEPASASFESVESALEMLPIPEATAREIYENYLESREDSLCDALMA